VDSGVDLDHPELGGLLVAGQDLVDLGTNPGVPLTGWVWEGDFSGRDNVPQDEVGHGTHVAGTIACASNNGTGVAGVTWGCPVMPVKVLNRARRVADNRVSGFGTSVDIAAGIRWAADHGAQIINLSLGGPTNDTVTANAVAYAVSRGCLVVAAMGNTGDAVPQFPAALPDVLSVAAVDINDRRAAFSSMGPHVDVSAPGVGILSTVWDNNFTTMDGTSMASPHVAGAAALMLSCNPSLTSAQLTQMIRDSARALRDVPADPVPNERYGSGLVDAKAAVDLAVESLAYSMNPSEIDSSSA
jgi:subtilisin family serine protease